MTSNPWTALEAPPPLDAPEPEDPFDPELDAQAAADAARERTFPCAQCGAKLTFQPGTHALVCGHCGHENPIPQSGEEIREIDFNATVASRLRDEDYESTRVVKCQSCAAEYSVDPTVQAESCPFCGSPQVVDGGSNRHLKPRSLLPFVIDSKTAPELFRKWLGGLWFAPNRVKQFARLEGEFTGMYVPYWTYDAATRTYYRGQRGTRYTTTVGVGKDRRTVTKIRWRNVSGVVWRDFDDVLVLASKSLPRSQTERLEPWDLDALVAYDDAYLSGFRAEAYHVDLEEGFGEAKYKMEQVIRGDIRRDIGGDAQRITSMSTEHSKVTFKHVLLPIWINAYRDAKKVYRFVINGRTGEVQGERPISWIKVGLLVLGIAAAVAVGWYLYTQFGQ
ncbi:MAG: primosomal protein N' (replication factor Y) - superfamily II helicase [Alphaproteobacteria bacterium]